VLDVRDEPRREVDFFLPPAFRAPVLRAAGLRRVAVFRALVLRVDRLRVEAFRVVRREDGSGSEGIPIPVSCIPGCSPMGCIGISSVTSANLPVFLLGSS
jgi:hypothetical protein